ncbi:MAG: DUF4872 domain-containing protein [Halobacteriaceae archaeon]
MERPPGYAHETGRDCGAAAVRDLLAYHEWRWPTTEAPADWDLTEAAVFALGSGIGSIAYETDDGWTRFCGRTPWLVANVFAALDVQHLDSRGDDWETALGDVTARLDDADPSLLFLDPASLDRALGRTHQQPHVVAALDYDDESVLVADPAATQPLELSHERLRSAWTVPAPFESTNRHLTVQDVSVGVDRETAASRAVRRTLGYMLDTPERDDRTWGTRGTHGTDAVRDFADEVARWPTLDPETADDAIGAACRAIAGEADAAAHRRLYAEGLDRIGPAAGLAASWANRAHDIADEWAAIGDEFIAAYDADAGSTTREEHVEAAASALGAVAEDEARFFADVREQFRA